MEALPFEEYVSGKYGAPMGRRSEALPKGARVHLRRVPAVDGDYDKGGAYWGSPGGYVVNWIGMTPVWGPKPLYCAWVTTEAGTVAHYFRAASRQEARQTLADTFAVTFYR